MIAEISFNDCLDVCGKTGQNGADEFFTLVIISQAHETSNEMYNSSILICNEWFCCNASLSSKACFLGTYLPSYGNLFI